MQVIHIGDKLTHVKDVAVEKGCRGIAFFQYTFILGFTSPAPRVERMSEDGDVLNTLIYDLSKVNLFSDPSYIHVKNTTDSARILVSDGGKKTVYMLNDNLQLLQTFKLPSGGRLWGLAAVGGVQVLVLVGSWGTRTLQLLDLTTGRWRTLLGLEFGLLQSVSLVYHQATKKLYGGPYFSDEVRVYSVRVNVS